MTQLFFTFSVSDRKQISAVLFMTQSDIMSLQVDESIHNFLSRRSTSAYKFEFLRPFLNKSLKKVISNWVELYEWFDFIMNENLRILAAVKVFQVEELTKMRLLSWTIDLKAGSLSHVETSLIGFSLEFFVSSHHLWYYWLLNLQSTVCLIFC